MSSDPFKENEKITRKNRIDRLLTEVEWDLKNFSNIKVEVDTKQSNFNAKDYQDNQKTWANADPSEFCDYLLLDSKGYPLAIIEAKKYAVDPDAGRKQAEDYVADIEKQTGKPIFIFLSNGREIRFWNKPYEAPRQLKGFYSQKDLERKRFQNENKQSLKNAEVKKSIVDRYYQIEAVKRVTNGIDEGKRKFLLVMATGTGKTRTAMALIDVLKKKKHVENVLFLADRRALIDQAANKGFKTHFPNESRSRILGSTIETEAKLHVATLQTLKNCYKKVSPGFFDILISDESHRSIFNKFKEIFTYFDAIQVGLTATPKDEIEKDTFRFFNCEDSTPTYNYEYEQAVEDKYLVPFKPYKAQTQFQRKGVTAEDLPESEKTRIMEEEGLTLDDLNWTGSKIEKVIAPLGTNEAIVKEFWAEADTDETGTLPGKTIIFAMTHAHAKRIEEAFDKLFPQYKGKVARIIDYQIKRREKLLKEFETEKWPRVAITVDMLSTGIDIEPIQNLVFARPIFSKTRFWQMIGRGTRKCSPDCGSNNPLCQKMKKERFLILDFWGNFEYFKIKPEGKKDSTTEALPIKIFKTRLNILTELEKKKKTTELEIVKQQIVEDVNSLPIESPSLIDHASDIEKVLQKNFWDKKGLDREKFLLKKISPLLKHKENVNYDSYSFIQKTEQLKLAILQKDKEKIDSLSTKISFDLECLPTNLEAIKKKEKQLEEAETEKYWKQVTLEDAFKLQQDFAPLMRYKRKEPRKPIVIDIDDIIDAESREWIEFGPEGKIEHAKKYRQNVEKFIREKAQSHPTIKKIKSEKKLSEKDIEQLEDYLNSPDLFITEGVLQKAYNKPNNNLVEFIKHILGLQKLPDREEKIRDAFNTYLVEKNLTANQILFLRVVLQVFLQEKEITMEKFFNYPFTNIPGAPTPLFSKQELKEIIRLCEKLTP